MKKYFQSIYLISNSNFHPFLVSFYFWLCKYRHSYSNTPLCSSYILELFFSSFFRSMTECLSINVMANIKSKLKKYKIILNDVFVMWNPANSSVCVNFLWIFKYVFYLFAVLSCVMKILEDSIFFFQDFNWNHFEIKIIKGILSDFEEDEVGGV